MCSKIFVKIHAVLRKLWSCAPLAMYPITHVLHPPRYPISIFNINHDTPLPMSHCPCVPLSMCLISHVPHHPCAPSPICPIPQRAPSLSSVLTMIPICPRVPLPTCQKICQVVKKMSSYQKDVKLSKRCQMSKSQTHWLWRRFTKKINSHNEVHTYWCQFWWWLKTLNMCIESVFGQFWWLSYLTSKLTSICVNLIMWIYFFCEPPP